jgi:hypothetical protein
MARLGHSSIRAATIYPHAIRDRDKAIDRALGELASKADGKRSGPRLAQNPAAMFQTFEKIGLPAERTTAIETA